MLAVNVCKTIGKKGIELSHQKDFQKYFGSFIKITKPKVRERRSKLGITVL